MLDVSILYVTHNWTNSTTHAPTWCVCVCVFYFFSYICSTQGWQQLVPPCGMYKINCTQSICKKPRCQCAQGGWETVRSDVKLKNVTVLTDGAIAQLAALVGGPSGSVNLVGSASNLLQRGKAALLGRASSATRAAAPVASVAAASVPPKANDKSSTLRGTIALEDAGTAGATSQHDQGQQNTADECPDKQDTRAKPCRTK